jgi:hypothetical protein
LLAGLVVLGFFFAWSAIGPVGLSFLLYGQRDARGERLQPVRIAAGILAFAA